MNMRNLTLILFGLPGKIYRSPMPKGSFDFWIRQFIPGAVENETQLKFVMYALQSI